MVDIQVTTVPQAVYPDGEQDPFVIRNNGPFSVYVDSDTSISNRSHQIPPTGVLPWDANRALYVVGDSAMVVGQYSTITIVRNSTATTFGNDIDGVLFTTNVLVPDGAGRLAMESNLIDASAYSSLNLSLTSIGPLLAGLLQPGSQLTVAKSWALSIRWFDKSLNVLETDSYVIPFNSFSNPTLDSSAGVSNLWAPFLYDSGGDHSSKLIIPVKGTYFRIRLMAGSSALVMADITPFQLTIVGSTRTMGRRLSWNSWDSMPSIGPGGTLFMSTYNEFGFSIQDMPSYAYAPLYLPCMGSTIEVTFRWTQTIATAGAIGFGSPYTTASEPWASDLAIPAAAAGGVASTIIRVPMGWPTVLIWRTIPQIAGPANLVSGRLSVTYLD